MEDLTQLKTKYFYLQPGETLEKLETQGNDIKVNKELAK